MVGLTDVEPVWHSTVSGMMFIVLYSFPEVPAAEVVYNVALGVLDLIPLEDLYARLFDETWDVEHLTERDDLCISANVRRGKHGDDGDAFGEDAEVDEIRVGHHIVS